MRSPMSVSAPHEAEADVAGTRANAPPQALQLAFAYLNRRERTALEVAEHLARRGCQPKEIDDALALLREEGYVDDARYARLFAQDKRELDQWGGERIRRTLVERGVERDLIAEALAGEPAEGELQRALALLERRFSSPPSDRRERDRAIGMLVRKGYDADLALDALAAYARGEQ